MNDIDMNDSPNNNESLRGNGKNFDHISLQNFQKEVRRATDRAFPNNKFSRYTGVNALLISWEDEDPDLQVYGEILSLKKVLEEDYHFDVETYAIPSVDSHNILAQKILDFVKFAGDNGDRKDFLKIVYYGGHGSLAIDRGLSWTSRQSTTDSLYYKVQWSGIQDTLSSAVSDVLIILDCCSAGTSNTLSGNGATELIAACGFHEEANGPGPTSFTHTLIKVLHDMSTIPSFTVATLYTQVLSRLHNHLPEEHGYEQMKAPIHAVLNYNAPASVIQLSAIRNPKLRLHDTIPTGSSEYQGPMTFDLNIYPGNTPSIPDSTAHQSSGSISSPLSSSSSSLSSEAKYPMFLLSVRLRESLNIDSFSDIVADWIKAMPIAAESIKFDALYSSFSTLLIISMPIPMWCYFKRHPAITCLGIVTSRPMITPHNLCSAVKTESVCSSVPKWGYKGEMQDNIPHYIKVTIPSTVNWESSEVNRMAPSIYEKIQGHSV